MGLPLWVWVFACRDRTMFCPYGCGRGNRSVAASQLVGTKRRSVPTGVV